MIFVIPFLPLLPVTGAGQASHDEDPVLIGEIKEVVADDLAFEAYRVEVHIADVFQLLFLPGGRLAEHHVWCVAGATDEYPLAVDTENTMGLRIAFVMTTEYAPGSGRLFHLARNLADAEVSSNLVRG